MKRRPTCPDCRFWAIMWTILFAAWICMSLIALISYTALRWQLKQHGLRILVEPRPCLTRPDALHVQA